MMAAVALERWEVRGKRWESIILREREREREREIEREVEKWETRFLIFEKRDKKRLNENNNKNV